jgi:hypothetical protein
MTLGSVIYLFSHTKRLFVAEFRSGPAVKKDMPVWTEDINEDKKAGKRTDPGCNEMTSTGSTRKRPLSNGTSNSFASGVGLSSVSVNGRQRIKISSVKTQHISKKWSLIKFERQLVSHARKRTRIS